MVVWIQTSIWNSYRNVTDNEINIDFSLNNKASLDSDKAVVDKEIQQSGGPGLYRLDNVYNCDCDLKQVKEVQLSQPNVNVMNNGGGWIGQKGCLVDSDSNVRFDLLTNKKFIHQLPTTVNQGPSVRDNLTLIPKVLLEVVT